MPVKTLQPHPKVRIRIDHDPDPESPRTWDNLGTMACAHRRYTLGDDQIKNQTPADYFATNGVTDSTHVILPLYLLDHSGLSMRTDPHAFKACDPHGWDWGLVGWIYAKRGTEDLTDEQLTRNLVGEVETYSQYLNGEVYGYVIQTPDNDHADSCWGFYGLDDCVSEALAAAKSFIDDLNQQEADLLEASRPDMYQ